MRASFVICACNLGGGMLWVEENFEKFDHAVSSKESLLMSFESCLHPLMLGEVSCRRGCISGL